MAKLPKPVKNSQQAIDSRKTKGYLGPYLPLSGLCNPCFRAIWLGFRWCTVEDIDAQTQRRFDYGNDLEPKVVADLQDIGCTVTEVQTNVIGYEEYTKGKLDGEVEDLPEAPNTVHILEIKSMNEKNFEKFRIYGIKKSHPKYYGQAQLYAHYRNRKRILFVVENKNTQERRHERLRYDKQKAEELVERSKAVVTTGELPHKGPGFTAGSYHCRFCKHGEFCYADQPPEVTCRSCVHCDLIGEGKWWCSKHDKPLSTEQQKEACKKYKRLF